MVIFKHLLQNEEYLNVVRNIETMHFISNGKWDWEHGLGHFMRVADYTETILKFLGADERAIDIGRATALLHDIGLSYGEKMNHAKASAHLFSKFLEGTDISSHELLLMEHAILDHSRGIDMKTPLDIALTLADKLDVTYHRTIHSTIQDYVNREIQKIKKVEIFLLSDFLKVNYMTDKDFDVTILREWDKSYLIPLKVALLLQKVYKFRVNDEVTILEDDIRRCLKNEK